MYVVIPGITLLERVAWKEASLADLSLGTWLLSMSDGLVWGLYSFIQQDTSILVFAVFQLTTSGTIVLLKLVRPAGPSPVSGICPEKSRRN